jgi:hypothetical protein
MTHRTPLSGETVVGRVVIRSGSFEPWANFALTASIQPFDWFDDERVEILPAYVERRARIRDRVVPDLP